MMILLKKFFFLLLPLLFVSSAFGNEEYSIHSYSDWTSTKFDIQANGNSIGSVEKSALGIRTHYNLKNSRESYGTCTSRLFSWGSVRNCWKEFDFYDNGKYGLLGTIRSIDRKESSAQFEISDWTGTVFAIATVDLEEGIAKVFQAGNPKNVYLIFEAMDDEYGELYWKYTRINRWFGIQAMHAFAAILADYFPPINVYTSD